MKAFGYETDGNTLIKLEEISFQVSVDDLDRMIKFFQMCRDELDTHGVNFGHDTLKIGYGLRVTQFVRWT